MQYKFTFSQEQLIVINQALQELPFKIAAPMFDYINAQIKYQEESNLANLEAEKIEINNL